MVEAELVAAKIHFGTADSKLENKFIQQISQTNMHVDELATRIEDSRVEVDASVTKLLLFPRWILN
jgi:predicted transcriptional regulator